MRHTGITVIGDAPWGAHFCQFYQTKQDLADILVPYFKVGLENNEFCMWITSPDLTAEEAEQALRKQLPSYQSRKQAGQIEILPYSDWYLLGGRFDLQRVLNSWIAKLDQALAKGFEGLRLSGNTVWLEKKDWKGFAEYEHAIDSVIGRYQMIALCTYSLEKCGAFEILDVVRNHQFALIRAGEQWQMIETTERKRAEQALRESEELKRAKQALQEANERLEERVAERTSELRQVNRDLHMTQNELVRANEELEIRVKERTAKLQELVGELEHFSYSITHDMRAPLRALSCYSHLMLTEDCAHCANTTPKDYLTRMDKAAKRMDQLITDALQYSKAVRTDLVLEPVDAAKLLTGMLESYPNLQPPHSDIRLEGEFPWVIGNEAALTQCFSNILGNAVKFVAPGVNPKVRIWASARDGMARLSFQDNGIGISKETQTRIFDLFQRDSKVHEGTGIGLALVRKNADRMGGRVGVDSELGRGSCFWLELKLARAESNGNL